MIIVKKIKATIPTATDMPMATRTLAGTEGGGEGVGGLIG